MATSSGTDAGGTAAAVVDVEVVEVGGDEDAVDDGDGEAAGGSVAKSGDVDDDMMR
jgi:hypothetical protein